MIDRRKEVAATIEGANPQSVDGNFHRKNIWVASRYAAGEQSRSSCKLAAWSGRCDGNLRSDGLPVHRSRLRQAGHASCYAIDRYRRLAQKGTSTGWRTNAASPCRNGRAQTSTARRTTGRSFRAPTGAQAWAGRPSTTTQTAQRQAMACSQAQAVSHAQA